MMTSNTTSVAYTVITINRSKEVVRSTEVSSWGDALHEVAKKREAAEANNWKTFVNDNAYFSYPRYVVRKNPAKFGGSFVTSFSMINGSKAEGGEYFFTYIKKVA